MYFTLRVVCDYSNLFQSNLCVALPTVFIQLPAANTQKVCLEQTLTALAGLEEVSTGNVRIKNHP